MKSQIFHAYYLTKLPIHSTYAKSISFMPKLKTQTSVSVTGVSRLLTEINQPLTEVKSTLN